MHSEQNVQGEQIAVHETQSGTVLAKFVGARTRRQHEIVAGMCELFVVALQDGANVVVDTTNDNGIVSVRICAETQR